MYWLLVVWLVGPGLDNHSTAPAVVAKFATEQSCKDEVLVWLKTAPNTGSRSAVFCLPVESDAKPVKLTW